MCATRITLWGLVICTEQETISLPDRKLKNAQEFLAQPWSDPGVSRITLDILQKLRGGPNIGVYVKSPFGPNCKQSTGS